MVKNIYIYLLIILSLSIAVFSIDSNTVNCEFKETNCNTGEFPLFYANGNSNFEDINGNVLSSHIRINKDANYNKNLCCSSPYGNFSSNIIDSTLSCNINQRDIMYFTNHTNAKIGIKNLDNSPISTFNLSYYTNKLCINIPNQFSTFNIIVSNDNNYELIGYSCLYKMSSTINGLISSCDATFNGSQQYEYTAWGRMWENSGSLSCNSDCTSKLDGRVYVACQAQLESCQKTPSQCDGALLNSWIKNNNNDEIQCGAPWNVYRSKIFTNNKVVVKTIDDSKCENLIIQKHQVILDDKLITMRIYVCN